MTKFIFIGIFALSPSAWARTNLYPDVRIERITRYVPELQNLTEDFKAGDLIIFDLDNTVFRETQMLGTDEWYEHVSRDRKDLAKPQVDHINYAVKHRSRFRLMESELPQFIRQLQDRGVYTLGLTARHPDLARSTLRNLLAFDIDFTRHGLPEIPLLKFSVPGSKKSFLYKGGVLFSDGANKGITLRYALKSVGLRPQRVAAVDDKVHHVESYVETIQELEINGVLIHYLRVLEEPPFEPEVADVQLTVFQKLGLTLTDQEAREFLARNPGFEPTSLNWSCSRLLAP